MKRYLTIVAAAIFFISGLLGMEQKSADATASVPALDSFHQVIAQIWHKAWPDKDVAMLTRLAPDVEKGIADVASAKLPGILHEKQAGWDAEVKKLQAVGAEYKAAAAAKAEKGLMDAAEALHRSFEMLGRAIWPALDELDEFHSALYMVYHDYIPKNDLKNIRASAIEMKQKMAALNAAKLPERLKLKESAFAAAREALSKSVDAFESTVKAGTEKAIKEAMETLHSNYQALDKVFQ